MNQVQQFLEYIFNTFKIWIIVQPWEAGLRVRRGKTIKKLGKGIYFKLPYLDSVYVQEVRLRIIGLPVQTITTKDFKTVTFSGAIGYIVADIEKLYQTLFHPEQTISNMAMSKVVNYISINNAIDIDFNDIEKLIIEGINEMKYGVEIKHYKIINFAAVRTYRLIQDTGWHYEGNKMTDKK